MAVLLFVAVVVVGFLLLVVGCADELRCQCVASWRGLFMSCSANQNHCDFEKGEIKDAKKKRCGTWVPNDAS